MEDIFDDDRPGTISRIEPNSPGSRFSIYSFLKTVLSIPNMERALILMLLENQIRLVELILFVQKMIMLLEVLSMV